LIDAHDRPVCEEVWALYDLALESGGPVATLIEWDNDIPAWETLFAQAQMAERRLKRLSRRRGGGVLPGSNEPGVLHGQ